MFGPQQISKTGFQIVDAEASIEKEDRALAMPTLATIAEEETFGSGNWNILRPGLADNMMFWSYDKNGLPPRGTSAGAYSFAFPARRDSGGKFKPLAQFGQTDPDFEDEDIQEATQEDWIILATSGHGTREKIAFRASGHGGGIIIIADHRSDSPPDLSTIVHDGKGTSHDTERKSGMDTAWEVRKWKAPNPNVPGPGSTSSGGWETPESEEYSIAWVGAASPEGKGFARISFGDRDGLFSHLTAGPFAPSFQELHLLDRTTDGDIISGALTTKAFFRGTMFPYSAPLHFKQEKYPAVQNGPHEYEVHLKFDKGMDHDFAPTAGGLSASPGKRPGMWRWYTKIPLGETPPCSGTKDYQQTDGDGNPKRTYSEDSRLFSRKKMVTSGLYFAPRTNVTHGRIPNREYGIDR